MRIKIFPTLSCFFLFGLADFLPFCNEFEDHIKPIWRWMDDQCEAKQSFVIGILNEWDQKSTQNYVKLKHMCLLFSTDQFWFYFCKLCSCFHTHKWPNVNFSKLQSYKSWFMRRQQSKFKNFFIVSKPKILKFHKANTDTHTQKNGISLKGPYEFM